jgi:hypothetical protein
MSEYKFHKLLFLSAVFKMRYFWLSYFCNENVTLVSTARCYVRVSVSEELYWSDQSVCRAAEESVFYELSKMGNDERTFIKHDTETHSWILAQSNTFNVLHLLTLT